MDEAELKREIEKLKKKLKDKQTEINALVEHLNLHYNYSTKKIFNIIEKYKEK